MNFLVDAHLPDRLARQLRNAGHDAIHCDVLPSRNRSSDAEIAALADAGDRVVATKDRDFRDAHLLRGVPRRLLLVVPATSATTASWRRWPPTSPRSCQRSERCKFVELSATSLVVHEDPRER